MAKSGFKVKKSLRRSASRGIWLAGLIMWKFLLVSLAFFGLAGTALFGVEAAHVGLFATEEELAKYPWGAELGWFYLNRQNYMLVGSCG